MRGTWAVRGFTLIELAFVLVIIGLLIGGGFAVVGPILDNTKRTDTATNMAQIDQALTLWVMRNGCLPCPADATVAQGNALYGVAEDNAGAAMTTCQTPYADPQSCQHSDDGQGVVPWETLGLTRDDALDGWNNFFRYRVDADLTQVDDDGLNSMERCASIFPDGDDGGPNAASNCTTNDALDQNENLTVEDTAGSTLTTEAAYVLISFGPDGSDAYNSEGVVQADKYTSTPQNENSDNDTTFVMDDFIELQGANYFDDIVTFRTAPMVISDCGPGSCGNP